MVTAEQLAHYSQASAPSPLSEAMRSYPTSEVGGCDERATQHLRSGGAAEWSYPVSKVGGAAERSYPASEVRGCGQEELPHA